MEKMMTIEEIVNNLTTLYNKIRRNYNFESRDYICHATFKEVSALKEALGEMEEKLKEEKN